ncbi:MAG: preprotein translocase subunit SecA [Anaerolineales bacterium]|nr:MAG: preprotein translocase subunit SecA [Anaerolineales bacterium]
MFKSILTKVVGDPNEKELNRLWPIVEEINTLEPEFEKLSNEELRALTAQFKAQIAEATVELKSRLQEKQRELAEETDFYHRERIRVEVEKIEAEVRKAEEELLEGFLPRAFAAVREASKRTTGMRHFDVQLLGGIVLHQGKVAEMKTGEGKTLVATLPIYLNALTGRGAHLVTVNDYLAKRDTQWMGPIYHLLGLSVGVIQSAAANPDLGSFLFAPDYLATDDRFQYLRPIRRREAYAADVTYGTNNEFGFDYLRDNMVRDLSQCVERELHYAIVDEVDNILIDEARTPLIISGQAEESAEYYETFARLVPRLHRGSEEDGSGDYVVDEKARVATLTEEGIANIEKWLGIDNLYSPENFGLTPYLDNALRAYVLFKRDRDYIVRDHQVIIVDEFTGRLMHGRRYSEGLHQAIEAKEGVRVQRESLTLATITFQNYFRMYRKLAGMTGTAATEAEEFHKIYNLDVMVIPTNKPLIRTGHPDVVYKSEAAKFRAVGQEMEELHKQGRPVLVGTISIERSEMLSEMLRRRGISHQVLNAKRHEKEATIIAQAGRPGAVTIATNMAGRGVDILLGGNPEGLARDELRRKGVDLTTVSAEEWGQALTEATELCQRDKEKVLALGGLHILGTERHEARRIDNQLRGRSGRQGDPGSSRFYLSLEDDLMRRFGGYAVANLMERLGVEDDIPIEHNLVSKSIENAQIKVEGHNFDIRKHVLEYDDVVNKQREVIYEQRRQILSELALKPIIMRMVGEEFSGLVSLFTSGNYRDEWDLTGLYMAVKAILPLPASQSATIAAWEQKRPEEIEAQLLEQSEQSYNGLEASLGRESFRQAQRTGLRLAELAEADPRGLYNLLYQNLEHHLDSQVWEEIKAKPLSVLDRDTSQRVQEAFGQVLALQHDRQVMLQVIDSLWVRHLTDLDNLREGIGLRAYGQQDPLVAYKKEAHEMYQDLLVTIQHDIVNRIFRPVEIRIQRPRPVREMRTNLGGGETRRPVKAVDKKVGRNDPCPCGSGKKYKHCHGRADRVSAQKMTPQPAGATGDRQQKRRKKKRRKR